MDAIKSIKKCIILFPPPHLTNILFRNFYLLPLYRRRFRIERQSLFNFLKKFCTQKETLSSKQKVSPLLILHFTSFFLIRLQLIHIVISFFILNQLIMCPMFDDLSIFHY